MGKNATRGAPVIEQDMEHRVVGMIKNFCVYTSLGEKSNEWPQLKKEVDATFRAIASLGDYNVGDKQTKNMRLNKPILKSYLSRRYNKRLSAKLCALFDWSNQLDYKGFYEQLDVIVMNSGITSYS